MAQTPDKLSERLSVRQELALQERNNAPPLVAQLSTRADGSPYFDPTNENYPIALSLSSVETTTTTTTTKPDLIVANDPPCSPANYPITTGGKLKRRGGKQRRGGATTKPESLCPLPATTTTTTDTDTHPPQTDGQQPQTEEKGQEQGGQVPHDGSPQPEELKWPNLFRIPTNDGDSPACFEATNGLMPVGVCENPQQQPEPSRWDIFMQVNRNVDPQAWKLPDSTLGVLFYSSFPFPAQSGLFNFGHRHCTHILLWKFNPQ